MATLEQANMARKRHASRLRRLGAHSLEVRPGKALGIRGHVVVANVPRGFQGKLPTEVAYEVDGTTVKVPVAVQETEPFRAE